jgi:hypothetical protein
MLCTFTVVEALVVIILERTLASLTASASSAATIVAATWRPSWGFSPCKTLELGRQ